MSSIFGVPVSRKTKEVVKFAAKTLLSSDQPSGGQPAGVIEKIGEFYETGLTALKGLFANFKIPFNFEDPLSSFTGVSENLKEKIARFWSRREALDLSDVSELAIAVADELSGGVEGDVEGQPGTNGGDDE